jgi:hypothetical protein
MRWTGRVAHIGDLIDTQNSENHNVRNHMLYLNETEDNINMDLEYRLLSYDLIYSP